MKDIIIIGAGPAGLATALSLMLHAKKNGVSPEILIVDKNLSPWEKPCGGMILRDAFRIFPSISTLPGVEISGIRIVYRNIDNVIWYSEPIGKNIGRKTLLKFFFKHLDKLGIDLELGFLVRSVSAEKDHVSILGKRRIRARVIVGADGAASITRRIIFRKGIKLRDFGLAYQVWVKSSNSLEPINEFYYGREYSPAGYAWVFPHVDHLRIGIGALADRVNTSSLRIYLKKLLKLKRRKFNEIKIIREDSFLVPLSGGLKPIVHGRILLVGDAAHQVSPLSGAGIHLAIKAGALVGKVLADYFSNEKPRENILIKYEKVWNSMYGRRLRLEKILVDFLLMHGSKFGKNKIRGDLIKAFADVLVGQKDVKYLVMKYLRLSSPALYTLLKHFSSQDRDK